MNLGPHDMAEIANSLKGLLEIDDRTLEIKACGANKPGGGGFSAGNTCARGGKGGGWTGDPKDNPAKSDVSDAVAHNVSITIYDAGRGSTVDKHFESYDTISRGKGAGSLESEHVKTSASALAKGARIARAIGLSEVTVSFEGSRGSRKTAKVKVPKEGDLPRPTFE